MERKKDTSRTDLRESGAGHGGFLQEGTEEANWTQNF